MKRLNAEEVLRLRRSCPTKKNPLEKKLIKFSSGLFKEIEYRRSPPSKKQLSMNLFLYFLNAFNSQFVGVSRTLQAGAQAKHLQAKVPSAARSGVRETNGAQQS